MDSRATMVTVLGALEIGLIVAVCYFLSAMVGTKDTGNDLAKTVIPVTGSIGGIVMVHTLLWYLYFTYEPMSMNLYFLVSGSMSLIVSLVALSISLVSRS
jgi:hypothetical protein